MILKEMFKDDEDFVCEVTRFLDSNAKSSYFSKKYFERGYTYIYDPIWSLTRGLEGKDDPSVTLGLKPPVPKDYTFLPIRRPGKTIGHIRVSKKLVIESLEIYDDSIEEFKITNKDLEVYIGRRINIMCESTLVFKGTENERHFVSELTAEMDKYLKEEYPKDMFVDGYTYLDYVAFDVPERKGEMIYAIRTPGATRANLVVDVNTLKVKELILIEETCKDEYNENIAEICNKYIGKKVKIIGGK